MFSGKEIESMQLKAVSVIIYSFFCLFLFAYCAFLLPIAKSFPYTDDWTYVSILGESWSNFSVWVFAQHVDHRIPFMKVMQFGMLRLSGFDFRSLLVLNAVIAVGGALAFFGVAQRFRGRSHIGDLIIPLILLSPGFGAFAWGFSAQFLFSVASTGFFLLALSAAVERQSKSLLALAFFFLLFCACAGANGVMTAAFIAAGLLALSFRRDRDVLWLGARYGSIAILLVSLVLILSWTPSGASVSIFSVPVAQVLDWAYNLSKSSFVVSAIGGGWWRAALLIGLTAAAAGVSAFSLKTSRAKTFKLSLFESGVYVAFFAYLALGALLVLGRSAHEPWSGGLEMHYGYLMTPLPILAWIIVSRAFPAALNLTLALVLVGAYAGAFLANAQWRLDYSRSVAGRVAEVAVMLRSDAPPSEITAKHMLDLVYIDTPEERRNAERGILKLRELGGPLYGKVQ